jgi:hypothetical protein
MRERAGSMREETVRLQQDGKWPVKTSAKQTRIVVSHGCVSESSRFSLCLDKQQKLCEIKDAVMHLKYFNSSNKQAASLPCVASSR